MIILGYDQHSLLARVLVSCEGPFARLGVVDQGKRIAQLLSYCSRWVVYLYMRCKRAMWSSWSRALTIPAQTCKLLREMSASRQRSTERRTNGDEGADEVTGRIGLYNFSLRENTNMMHVPLGFGYTGS
jgi:hypothetical protein